MPLVGRLLACSCPGLLVIVEMPGYEREGEDGRSGSPVTDGDSEGDSLGMKKSIGGDDALLHLVCNGFEVLTGKMPRLKSGGDQKGVGEYTLDTIGWSRAGVVAPRRKGEGVAMKFSNRLMVPTEGIVVTYGNGSMVQLTVRDPVDLLEELLLPVSTPILLFSFCKGDGKGRSRVEMDRRRSLLGKRNVFVVEIGYRKERMGRREMGVVDNGVENGASARDSSPDTDGSGVVEGIASGSGASASGSASDTLESFPDRDTPDDEQEFYGLPPPRSNIELPLTNPVTTDTVPNAVPLFVNTLTPPVNTNSENGGSPSRDEKNDDTVEPKVELQKSSPSKSKQYSENEAQDDLSKRQSQPPEAKRPRIAEHETRPHCTSQMKRRRPHTPSSSHLAQHCVVPTTPDHVTTTGVHPQRHGGQNVSRPPGMQTYHSHHQNQSQPMSNIQNWGQQYYPVAPTPMYYPPPHGHPHPHPSLQVPHYPYGPVQLQAPPNPMSLPQYSGALQGLGRTSGIHHAPYHPHSDPNPYGAAWHSQHYGGSYPMHSQGVFGPQPPYIPSGSRGIIHNPHSRGSPPQIQQRGNHMFRNQPSQDSTAHGMSQGEPKHAPHLSAIDQVKENQDSGVLEALMHLKRGATNTFVPQRTESSYVPVEMTNRSQGQQAKHSSTSSGSGVDRTRYSAEVLPQKRKSM